MRCPIYCPVEAGRGFGLWLWLLLSYRPYVILSDRMDKPLHHALGAELIFVL